MVQVNVKGDSALKQCVVKVAQTDVELAPKDIIVTVHAVSTEQVNVPVEDTSSEKQVCLDIQTQTTLVQHMSHTGTCIHVYSAPLCTLIYSRCSVYERIRTYS